MVALAAAALAGCGSNDDDADVLRDALRATETMARSFVYVEDAGGERAEVRGLVEDDFRFKTRLAIAGRPVSEEVVSDDARAMRFLDARRLADVVRNPTAGQAETDREGVTVIDALRSGRWVSDPTGAAPTVTTAAEFELQGVDHVRDALVVLGYVDRAIGRAFTVQQFNPDSLDYKPSEDPFPTPEKGSGVTRYDLVPPFLPRPEAVREQGTGASLPGVRNLRKLAVYVEDGLVIRVAEEIAAEGDIADRLRNYLRAYLADTSPEARDLLDASLEAAGEERRSEVLIAALNQLRVAFGEDPIRFRSMAIDFVGLGEDLEVDYPDDVIQGALGPLFAEEVEDVTSQTEPETDPVTEPEGESPPVETVDPEDAP
ncbi:MAG TPA: hypothetical protein VMN58_08275 [Acidimicrobiales bacterium]|nr:hypothetical protein [Acidimicrobiales bacterium]